MDVKSQGILSVIGICVELSIAVGSSIKSRQGKDALIRKQNVFITESADTLNKMNYNIANVGIIIPLHADAGDIFTQYMFGSQTLVIYKRDFVNSVKYYF